MEAGKKLCQRGNRAMWLCVCVCARANTKMTHSLFKQKRTLNTEVTAIIPPYLGRLCCLVVYSFFVLQIIGTHRIHAAHINTTGFNESRCLQQAKTSVVNVRFERYSRGDNKRASISTTSTTITHTNIHTETEITCQFSLVVCPSFLEGKWRVGLGDGRDK